MILEIRGDNPQPRRIEEAARHLRKGGLIAYPTDTVYAVGCDIRHKKAAQLLQKLKDRHHPEGKKAGLAPSLLVSNLSSIAPWAIVEDHAYRLLKLASPGPYTFILKASREVPRVMIKKRRQVGIRVPDSAVVRALCDAIDGPLLSTTARAEDGELLFEPRAIEAAYRNSVQLVLDTGPLIPKPSTVIDLSQGVPEVLREGKGDLEAIGLG